MNIHHHLPAIVKLSRGGLLSMRPNQRTQVQVLAGCIWLTQTGVGRDHFLRSGQVLELAPGLLTVLTAEDDSRFVLETPERFLRGWMASWRPRFRGRLPQPAKVMG